MIFLSMLSFFKAHAAFNLEELEILCEHVSSNKDSCLKEVKYLELSKKNNTTLNYCSENTNKLSSFKDCLENNTNPLIFLQYKKNETPSTSQLNIIKKDMIEKCQSSNNFENCLINGGIKIEKSKEPLNWIENHCARNSKNYYLFLECEIDLKKQMSDSKNILAKMKNISSSIEQIESLYNRKRTTYINQAFKVCNEKYGKTNVSYSCVQKLIEPVNEELVYFGIKEIPCLKSDTLTEYINCLK